MKFRVACSLLFLMVAEAAFALSCMRPDAVRLYENARDSEDTYWIAQGRLRLKERLNVPTPPEPNRLTTESHFADTRAQFLGRVLIEDGSFHPFARNITLRLSCLSVWCASAPPDESMIAAIRVDGDALVLDVDPCNSFAVQMDEDGLNRLVACHKGGECVVPLP